MAVQDNDLFLVQRGNTPFRETSQNVSTYVTQEITATVMSCLRLHLLLSLV